MALLGLSFSPGLRVQDEIRATLGVPVSSSISDSFLLVAAFGRCKFKLSERSVALILQATIGGSANCFKVAKLSDRVFKFTVACNESGLFIRRLFAFECDLYKVSFHLWGNGGPNWHRELELFRREEENSWHLANGNRQSKPSYVAIARSAARSSSVKLPLTGANSVPLGNGRARSSAVQQSALPRTSVFARLEEPRHHDSPRVPIRDRFEFPRQGPTSSSKFVDNLAWRAHLRQPQRGGAFDGS